MHRDRKNTSADNSCSVVLVSCGILRAMLSIVLLIAPQPAHAQTETVLYSFGSQSGDGVYPYAGLIEDSKGNFYGTTSNLGANGFGTVFELSPTRTETILYNFPTAPGSPFDYFFEGTLLMDKKGNLYGTTYDGGYPEGGTVYELAKPAKKGGSWSESLLFTFGGDQGAVATGVVPYAGLIMDKEGNLYSTTNAGGVPGGGGTVFEMTPLPASGTCPAGSYSDETDWCENELYSFGDNSTDGIYPYSSVITDKDGNLYGTDYAYGYYYGGSVYELSPVPANGVCPPGTTAGNNWCETLLYTFVPDSADGIHPYAGVIMDSKGNLYGTTFWGAETFTSASGYGAAYELSPMPEGGCPAGSSTNAYSAWCETIIYTFGSQSGDGENPYAGLIRDSKGDLYGTTYNGGANGYGTVFELSPPAKKGDSWTETILYNFCSQQSCVDGGNPVAGLIRDKEGNLYGTTQFGGANGEGTVFKVTP